MDLKKIGWADMDWINMAEDRDKLQALMRMVINLQVP
jgi:hypothetical protein